MTIQKPAWRKRSRPCPFFSQGRCLFADSCNFLHDIKVKSVADESLLDATQVKQQSSLPPKHVFDLPSLVVNSASPHSVNLRGPASPAHDSSRYSGLLSVLSDVIGHLPLSPVDEDSASEFQARRDSTLHLKDIKCSSGVSIPEVDSTSDDLESRSVVGDSPKLHPVEPDEQGTADYEGASSPMQPFVGEALSYSDDRNLGQDEVSQCKHDDGQPTSGFMPCVDNNDDDDDAYATGDATCYVVEDIEYVVGSGAEEEGWDAEEDTEEDAGNNPTVMELQRYSILSSFTGASLLASPRSSVFEEAPVQDAVPDLLSPVELSARLRPFSMSSFDVTCRRGDSIDSGYADGDNWVGPNPFPDSPPNSARSSMNFLPFQSRRMSLVSPILHERRVSYDVRATRPSLHLTIDTIEEHTSDESSEDSNDATCSILGAYDTSPSSQGEIEADFASPTLRVSLPAIAERSIEESDGISGSSTVLRTLRLDSPQLLHPTGEHEIDLHGQLSFASEDNTSFKTALSTQSSFEDFSDVSGRASPDKQDSLLSSTSYCSTPNTSLQSHDDDLPDVLEQCTASSYACDYPHLTSLKGQLDSREDSKERSSADCSLPAAIVSDSNALQPSLASKLDFPHESVTQHIDSARNSWSGNSRSYALDSDPRAEPPYGPNLITDARGCAALDVDCREGVSFGDFSVSESYGRLELVSAPEVRSSAADHNPGTQEDGNSFDSEHVSASGTNPLQFPLPPVFLPTELLGHSSVNADDGMFIQSEVDGVEVPEDVTHAWSFFTRPEEVPSASDLTVELSPNQVPPVEFPDSAMDFISQRSRAASDLTVKGKPSPRVTLPEGLPATSVSSPTIHEQSLLSDSVQSLYDHYMHVAPSEDPGPSGCEQGDFEFSTAPRHTEQCSPESEPRSLELPVQVFHEPSSVFSRTEPTDSYSDSPRSETAFRPLLTGRRSLLNSSLSELVPKASPIDANERISVSAPSSARLQTRETGSTMVPLGFRRYNPQFAAKQRSEPPQSVLPAAEPRVVLRIRTDIAEQTSPFRCFSATPLPSAPRSPSPPQSAPPSSGLKPLRLSSILSNKSTFIRPSDSSSITSSILSPAEHTSNSCPAQSPSVLSSASFSRNSLLSSSRQPLISEQICNTLTPSDCNFPISQITDYTRFASQHPSSRRDSQSTSAPTQHTKSWRLSHYRAGSHNYTPGDATCRLSRTSISSLSYVVDEEEADPDDPTISRPVQPNYEDDWIRPASAIAAPVHAIATPKPTLLFAIASDDVEQVRQVLESGEAGPNDPVGPQSALAFTLTNDKLAHKQEIVKALLAYGANPSALRNPALNPAARAESDELISPPPETTLEGMDPATRYFVVRADAAHTRQTSQLIYRSFFRPLTRVRYDVIGQDWALEQLFRVLSMHSQKLAVAPIVVLLCGPSGHGKSLLARKFGFLLDVPTHTVNMTTLRSAHDIWQSYSMSPYEEPSSCTLAQFLLENEGKRCVVVLDEIEKVEDQKALWSLLIPWELGRCSLEAGKRHVDVRNVIWLGTSNIGHEMVFEHQHNRTEPDKQMTREEYLELTDILRPRVSHCLGASLVSRVTTVLPFVPFTLDERKAIAAEAVYALAGEAARVMSPLDVESLVTKALPSYYPGEGARSLHRAVSNLLVDATSRTHDQCN